MRLRGRHRSSLCECRKTNFAVEELFRTAQTASVNLEDGPVVRHFGSTLERRWTLILSLPAMSSDFRSLQNLVQEIGAVYEDEAGKLNSRAVAICPVCAVAERTARAGRRSAQKAKEVWTKFAARIRWRSRKKLAVPRRNRAPRNAYPLRVDSSLLKQIEAIAVKHDTSRWGTFC